MDPRKRPEQRQHHQYRPPAPAPAPANPNNFTSPAPFPRPQATPSPGSPFSTYPTDHRRTSDTPYYPPAARPSLATDLGHARAQSASSLPPARQLGRAMAPPPPTSPTSPTQPGPQHPSSQPAMVYGPPPPRPAPLAVGPPNAFPSARELPALGPLPRSGSAGGSSMSISSMLGGPPPASRDSQPPPSQHYAQHAAAPAAPGSSSSYAPSVHASPRMHSASSEYPLFRRPQTPDHQRPYDPRTTTAPSPRGHYSTPDLQRYGTPQGSYHSRHPSAPADTSREPGRMSAGPPGATQPKPYGGVAPRPMDVARPDEAHARREEAGPPAQGIDYKPERSGPRPYAYEDRFRTERERQGVADAREREGMERAFSGVDSHRHMLSPREMGRRDSHASQPQYGRPLEGRDQRDPRDAQWGRPGVESNYRAPMDHQRPPAELPSASGPYPPHHASAYQAAPPERYPSASHPPPHPQASSGAAPQPFEPSEHPRMDHMHQQHQHYPLHRPRHAEEAPQPPPPPSIAYNPSPFDSRGRTADEPTGPSSHQRNLLAVQDINRKGRVSPLPQAVQGVQPQHPGPAGEPGIKSEFGRMFSGIGSGVGAIGVSGPATSGSAAVYGNAPSIKREDVENAATDSGPEAAGKGKGRRRKLKDDEARGDDDTSGRVTPGGRSNKRAKAHQHHHHQYAPTPRPLHHVSDQFSREYSHHHHHHHVPEATSSPAAGAVPFKNLRGGPSPAEKGAPAPHHHHHHHHGPRAAQQMPGSQAKQPAQSPTPVMPPKPKMTITSKAVLDAVAHRPRHHLGDFIYEAGLKPGRLLPSTPSHRGYSSNPKPLPWDVIQGKENCILTVKVPRVHLSSPAREEITARAYLWGTDVYTDDSDVMAACIHGGWIKGEWADDFDSATLDLDDGHRRKMKSRANESLDLDSEGLINSPPLSGPLAIPANRDLHVNVLILPKLAKYAATTRFGISSREFGGQHGARQSIHDGISYMVESIRWVENGGQPQARLRGKARRERMRKVMKEVTASFGNTHGLEQHQAQLGKVQDAGILRGEIIGRWHRRGADEERPKECADPDDKQREPSEGDKENRLGHEGRPAGTPQAAEAALSENVEMEDVDAAGKPTSSDDK